MSLAKWFKRELPGGRFYYTPFPNRKRKFYSVGEGDRNPTPKELADALSADQNAYVERGLFLGSSYDSDTSEVPVELPVGCYRYFSGSWDIPECLFPKSLRDDTYVGVSSLYEPMAKEVRSFIQGKEIYKNEDRNILYRLGMLLVGPPGNGKTSLIREIAAREMPDDGVMIFMPSSVPSEDFTKQLDESMKNRIKLIVFEELAAALDYHPIEPLLDFLDGEASMDSTITIATTNYPQWLPPSLLERTSRFDLLFYMDNPNESERKEFLEKFGNIQVTNEDIKNTAGMSVSDLKEIILSAQRRNETFASAIERLRARKNMVDRILKR